MKQETIAAIATGVGGGVGIVRVSGPRAEEILTRLVGGAGAAKKLPTHKLQHGWVRDPSTGEKLDEVMAVLMRAPRSYTGEDVAELHGHGGAVVLERVLRAVLACGARMAQPGEFTRRAFEAGRIDLTRAEAVAEIIAARSERALAAAEAVSGGALQKEVAAIRLKIVTGLAELEGGIDFPDESAGEAMPDAPVFAALGERLRALAGTYSRALQHGAEVALVGRVNAGKSSIFNMLCGEERAVVDADPGTTRDAVQAEVRLGGLAVRLVDTAGEREDPDRIERRGLELARKRRGAADAVMLVVDGTVGFEDAERKLWDELGAMPRLVVWNKRDVAGPASGLPEDARVVETAAVTGAGADALRAALREALGDRDEDSGLRVVTQRHAEALGEAAGALERAVADLRAGQPPELAAGEARGALHHLGRVTGETVDADVLDAIFARFCIGK